MKNSKINVAELLQFLYIFYELLIMSMNKIAAKLFIKLFFIYRNILTTLSKNAINVFLIKFKTHDILFCLKKKIIAFMDTTKKYNRIYDK